MSEGGVRPRPEGLIIAVDGPSGAGKSTITRLLSQRLGYLYIDTGAMYRAVALAVRRAGVSPDDDAALVAVCRGVEISFVRTNGCCQVLLNGEDVSAAIRTPEISMLTSRISARMVVRDVMVRLQRELGKNGGVILEGRDIGTVVFPDADLKFFLSASVDERGRRRYLELKGKGEDVLLERTIAEVAQRDEQDSRREHAPLRRADDAVDIDSTGLSIEEVVALMEGIIKEKLAASH
ncbi:MAG: (d)CMP kinase [Geobacteraceae bacterium]|nr:(d)CMP kinase [Geobacteraceae bacterium]